VCAERRAPEPGAERRRWNVIHFHSDGSLNQLYEGRVQKYLQPDFVELSAYADDAEAFSQFTGQQRTRWDLLVIDLARLQTHATLIRDFHERHPNCTILLLDDKLGNATINLLPQSNPRELDEWLTMMHSVISE
jgi:hypothetical protein